MLDTVNAEECKRLLKLMNQYQIRVAPCLRGRWSATAFVEGGMASVRQCLDPVDALKKVIPKIKLIEQNAKATKNSQDAKKPLP